MNSNDCYLTSCSEGINILYVLGMEIKSMYICICRAVTDKDIRAALEEGACTMRELRQRLGVCSDCGKCGPHARKLLIEHRELQPVSIDLIVQPA